MKLRYKKMDRDVLTPRYATRGSACFDIAAYSDAKYVEDGNYYDYQTGLAFEIPEGYVGLLFPRSSNTKKDLILGNSVGVVDSDYRGWVTFRYKNIGATELYKKGDRIGQMMIIKKELMELEEVDNLSETERGEGGYGSTGK